MPDLTGYPERLLPLDERASGLIELLERDRFHVRTTEDSRTLDGSRLTLVVYWDGHYVGYMKHDMWNNGGPILGYHFNPGTDGEGNACPPDFDLATFCKEHGVSRETLHVHPNGGQRYLRVRDAATALKLMRDSAAELEARHHSGHPSEDVQEDPSGEGSELNEVIDDIEDVKNRKDLSPTQKKRLTDARVGQGRYRKDLERIFGDMCAVTRLQTRQALRASHTVPWRESTDEERLDPNNGLLLSANLDALFDKHLITFDIEGKLRVSRHIKPVDREILKDLANLCRPPTAKQWAYLQRHTAVFNRLEAGQASKPNRRRSAESTRRSAEAALDSAK